MPHCFADSRNPLKYDKHKQSPAHNDSMAGDNPARAHAPAVMPLQPCVISMCAPSAPLLLMPVILPLRRPLILSNSSSSSFAATLYSCGPPAPAVTRVTRRAAAATAGAGAAAAARRRRRAAAAAAAVVPAPVSLELALALLFGSSTSTSGCYIPARLFAPMPLLSTAAATPAVCCCIAPVQILV